MFTWPSNELDEGPKLLALLGTFWANTYQGNDLVESLLHARARLDEQAHLDLLALVASMSRFNVPVFHQRNWHTARLRESEMNLTEANLARFDGAYQFDGQIAYDVPGGTPFFVWPAPTALVGLKVALNSITNSTVTWVNGQDFFLKDGSLWFRNNPFAIPGAAVRDVFKDGEVVDRECVLWLYRGEWDWNTVYEQFGYAVGLHAKSSEGYKQLINAVFDSLTQGSTELALRQAFAALCDVPYARGDETVQVVTRDSRHLWVITDKVGYSHSLTATAAVSVGDKVQAGDFLCDGVQFYEFNAGQVPTEIRALAIGKGVLAEGYYQDLVFQNQEVPWVIDTTGEYTKTTFEIGGMPSDVEKFWDDVHASGVAKGQTLAMLLDQRPEGARDTKPGPQALPTTVNPLGFLLQNLFRNNVLVVKLKSESFGKNALGMQHARVLRKIVPPQTLCIVLVELTCGDEVTMDGDGDEDRAGYEEDMSIFLGAESSDEIDPDELIDERIRVFQVSGQCT